MLKITFFKHYTINDIQGNSSIQQISRIGRELARSSSGTDQKTASNHLFQRLSLALQKGNAVLFLSRSTDVQCPDIMGQF